MKTSELTGALLDYWVARAERVEVTVGSYYGEKIIYHAPFEGRVYDPSANWATGGPIIEREEISLLPGPWSAQVFDETGLISWEGRGPTPLVAAMRAYVASKFGDEVQDVEGVA